MIYTRPVEPDEYRRLSLLESDLWWFRGMERISTALLEAHGGVAINEAASSRRVLDAGCGTGGMLRRLKQYGRTVGIDAVDAALTYARSKGTAPLVRGTVEHLPFADEIFDIVTSFDVIYHLNVSDDGAALSEFSRVLKKKGTLLIRVPACDWLRSRHDAAVHTRQRYGRRELVGKLRAAGLEPVFVSFANSFLFPIAVIRRLSESSDDATRNPPQGSEVQPVAKWLNEVLTKVLSAEAMLLRRLPLPIGLSLVAVARKR